MYWADVALRTLVWARCELPDWKQWKVRYDEANADVTQLQKMKEGVPCLITDLQAEIECGLTLQGATAIEDKLQAESPA